ncbi:adenylosuccinate synthetase [Sphingomonas bacterium]|uniref:adenylosuccinate synthetase n=1 Tax=Sphingomonas bacterium TaxID=1895847 RepID=UPI001575DFBA|nr:adenylosuccinate synthetase [Sphingomonas bacterium]
MPTYIVISGAIASGKTTLGDAILARVGGERMSTRQSIVSRTGVASRREELQRAGDELDRETSFGWVAEDALERAGSIPSGVLVVDAVRRVEQVDRLRAATSDPVRHIHLVANDVELARRHAARVHDVEEPALYDDVRASATEAAVDDLAARADVLMDASRLDRAGAVTAALAGLGLLPSRVVADGRLVDVVVGGQYGSEGKGNVCSFLAPEYQVLMRVGGPNAGHRVRNPDFDFVHLPSGTLHNPGARLLIGAGATLSLPVLLGEIAELSIGADRLSVDPQAIVIEDWDLSWEVGALEVIGSTKKGVGAATARKILGRGGGAERFGPPVRLARDVEELQDFVRPVFAELERAYAAGERIMLEGTQGTDLSLHHGMWPHVTSRETTASGCLADAGIPPTRVRDVVMVVRTYPIRVGGTSGGMGVEIGFDVVASRSGLDEEGIRGTEVGTVSKKPRRVAEFDLGQVRRAAALNGATRIALTFADYLGAENRGATSLEGLNPATREFVARMEEVTGAPVDLVATGPGRADVIDRREG